MFSSIGNSIKDAWEGFGEKWKDFKEGLGGWIEDIKDFFGFGGNGEGDLIKKTNELELDEIEKPENNTPPNGNGAGRRRKRRTLLGGNGPAPDTENGFPYYSQNDPRIKNKPYRMSNGQPTDVIETMGNRGCGPTAMAMVASKLKGGNGNPYSPENMARIAENGNYSTQNGTMPNYFTNVGSQLGMNVTPALATADNIDAMLGNGQPVIIQGASDRNDSPFTSGGHYVVAVGKDDSGNVLVNDPRGKSYSGKYTMNQLTDGSARAWGFSNPGGFGGTVINTVKGGFGKVKKLLKSVMGGNGASWIDVVKAVKKAIANKRPGYSQSRSIYITIGGKQYKVRTDCSGMVSACVTVYRNNGKRYITDSRGFANKSNSTLLSLGFKPMGWIGWNKLMEGDIIARDGHVEIFCRRENGKNYVYNAGGNDSINSAGATKTGHSSYTTVWRAPGNTVNVDIKTSSTGSVNGETSTNTSSSTGTSSGGLTKYSSAISQLAAEMIKPFQPEQTGEETTSTSSNTSSKDYSGADISGSDTAQKVWNFFTSIGYSKAATAGVLGNLYQESTVNPKSNADKPNSPAAGIAQWENYKNKTSRWKSLYDYAASKGKKWTDLKSQLEFIDKELHGLNYYFKTDVKYENRPGSTLSVAGATPTTFKKWKQSNDVDMATRQFEGAFERAGKPMMDRRVGAAKRYYKLYAGGNGEGLIGGNGDMEIPYVDNSSRDIRNKPYTNSSDDVRYITGNGNSAINQSLSRTEKLSKENSTYDDANVVAALGTVVSTLEDLLVEMRGTNEGVNKFNDKELVVKNTPVVYQQTNNNIRAGNGSGETQKPPKTVNNSTFIDDNKYRLARSIASGGYSFA